VGTRAEAPASTWTRPGHGRGPAGTAARNRRSGAAAQFGSAPQTVAAHSCRSSPRDASAGGRPPRKPHFPGLGPGETATSDLTACPSTGDRPRRSLPRSFHAAIDAACRFRMVSLATTPHRPPPPRGVLLPHDADAAARSGCTSRGVIISTTCASRRCASLSPARHARRASSRRRGHDPLDSLPRRRPG